MLYQINEETSKKLNDFFNRAVSLQTRKDWRSPIDASEIVQMSALLKGPNTIISAELNDNALVRRSNKITDWEVQFLAGDLMVRFRPNSIGSDSICIIEKDGTMNWFNTWHPGYKNDRNVLSWISGSRLCWLSEMDIEMMNFCGHSLESYINSMDDFKCACPAVPGVNGYADVLLKENCKFCRERSLV